MHYRLLNIDEWDKLSDMLPKGSIPAPNAASAAVAVDEAGNICGVLVGQLVLHVEPLVLTTPQVSFKSLFQTLMAPLASFSGLTFYAFSDSDVVAGMTAHLGMKAKPYRVWEGRIN